MIFSSSWLFAVLIFTFFSDCSDDSSGVAEGVRTIVEVVFVVLVVVEVEASKAIFTCVVVVDVSAGAGVIEGGELEEVVVENLIFVVGAGEGMEVA